MINMDICVETSGKFFGKLHCPVCGDAILISDGVADKLCEHVVGILTPGIENEPAYAADTDAGKRMTAASEDPIATDDVIRQVRETTPYLITVGAVEGSTCVGAYGVCVLIDMAESYSE